MAASNVVVKRGREQFGGVFSDVFQVTCTINFASAANGAKAEDSVTVPGVALGDVVICSSMGIDQAGLVMNAYVSAANTVVVVVANNTGGAVDLASTTVKLVVGKYATI